MKLIDCISILIEIRNCRKVENGITIVPKHALSKGGIDLHEWLRNKRRRYAISQTNPDVKFDEELEELLVEYLGDKWYMSKYYGKKPKTKKSPSTTNTGRISRKGIDKNGRGIYDIDYSIQIAFKYMKGNTNKELPKIDYIYHGVNGNLNYKVGEALLRIYTNYLSPNNKYDEYLAKVKGDKFKEEMLEERKNRIILLFKNDNYYEGLYNALQNDNI